MKKSYLMIAAAAGLMLAACSQEDDFVAQNAAAQQGDGAVLFDTYLSNNSTRAVGQTGAMTTSTLQSTGFGLVAVTHAITTGPDANGYPYGGYAAAKANFMWNQQVRYLASNWTYSPLKYWPNETTNDQQTAQATSTHKEGVSFFAYAPYVEATATAGTVMTTPTSVKFTGNNGTAAGLQEISDNDVASDPKIYYTASATPSESVDLLWGVSSGFYYHPVETNIAVVEPEGLPVRNMMKPALDEKIKFDFKHALARIGLTVVGAFDQVAQGGTKDATTKVTIKSITINSTEYGQSGILNLNNTTAHRALWTDVKNQDGDELDDTETTDFTIAYDGEMNDAIKWDGGTTFPANAGVLSTEQTVIKAKSIYTETATVPTYSPTKVYYTKPSTDYEEAVANYQIGVYKEEGTTYKYKDALVPVTTAGTYYDIDVVRHGTYADLTAYVAAEGLATDVLYTKSGDDYVEQGVASAVTFNGSTEFFCLKKTLATPAYASGTYYTRYDQPGYFMVIPYKREAATKDATVKVTIDYLVTTNDDHLKATASQIENVISQDVVLKGFGNGKAYTLKLILGLTSVKVDAEVSNWEVGTVESNLPQNLE